MASTSFRSLAMAAVTLTVAAQGQTPGPTPKAISGKFRAAWDSLQQYQCPDWFRDAKFGIWAHWSAQCVPEQGDWYARGMYQEGSEQYNYQVAHYGHPSKVGFKDIDHDWTAANWNPERLMELYVAAGAKYFVALANHHDNFDAWNSKYQPWNSVNIGPHKDIVGTWAAVARKHGLKFGVTVHAARSWDWFDVSHGADKNGPLGGVPYDGNLTKADGKGQWWEGYDPVELYSPAGAARTKEAFANYETKFFNRTMDLVGSYRPDLVYFDDLEPPTSNGLLIASNYYNMSADWHGGRNEGVMTVKNASDRIKKSFVLDYERGRSNKISPEPWQTDTCIGDWHYRRSLFDNHQYKTPEQVVRMLVDIVSKNGNLLLNIPVRGDGTIDEDEVKFLQGMAAWMKVNYEAIFGTRPWKIAGEGPVRMSGGGFSEGGEEKLTSEDFRFTTKGNTLYASAMGWPSSGKLVVKTLAAGADGIVGEAKSVSLLGSKDKLAFSRTAEGLVVNLPKVKPCDHAWVLKITGFDLGKSEPKEPKPAPVSAGSDGVFSLTPLQAILSGNGIQAETRVEGGNLGYWNNPADYATWRVKIDRAGTYSVSAWVAAVDASQLTILCGTQSISAATPATGSFEDAKQVEFGVLTFDNPGVYEVVAKPKNPATWRAINLGTIRLIPKSDDGIVRP